MSVVFLAIIQCGALGLEGGYLFHHALSKAKGRNRLYF